MVDLKATDTNFTEVLEAINGNGTIPPLLATGKTNIAESLKVALSSLTDKTKIRPQARKAIILFTDGVPNLPTDEPTGISAALTQADKAKPLGIPIYTIGLSTNPVIGPEQDKVLGDNKGGSGKGIAFRSGNGAFYIRVNNAAGLNSAFQSIARSLVVLQLKKD